MIRRPAERAAAPAMPAFCVAKGFGKPESRTRPVADWHIPGQIRHIPLLPAVISARQGYGVLAPRKEILILILALSPFAPAQPPDYHVTADPFHATYGRSAFLHGHRH